MFDGGRGWTGTIFITTIAALAMAILAYAMSGYRDARVSRNDTPPAASSSPDDPGDRVAR